MNSTISLIVSTYNQPRYLALSLQTVMRQSLPPNEIIIADDGSDSLTADTIKAFVSACHIPVKHVWQAHSGFRKSIIMNKAIAECTGDYIIQIDGDIMLHPDFIADHMRIARHGWMSCGTRVMLSQSTSERILMGHRHGIPMSVRFTTINAMRNRLVFSLWVRGYRSSNRLRMSHGCNCAFWRQDLLNINGYNEDYTGWGYEDSDLIIRLENAGVKKQIIKFGAIEYHLNHPHNSRANIQTNHRLLIEAMNKCLTRCSNGLDNHIRNKRLRVKWM